MRGLGWRALLAVGVAAVAVGALVAVVGDADDDNGGVPGVELAEGTGAGEQDPDPDALGGLEPEPAAVAVPQAPGGILTATSAGPVAVGMNRGEVSARLTAPDERIEVSLSAGPAPQENWTWHLPDGEFTVLFDTGAGEVAGFAVGTPAFGTVAGVRVGDPFAAVQESFGKRLRISPIGEDGYILSPGKPGSFPALVFWVPEGTIEQIQAGNPGPAGE